MIALLYILATILLVPLLAMAVLMVIILIAAMTGEIESWEQMSARLHCEPTGQFEKHTRLAGKLIVSETQQLYRCDYWH